MRCWSGDTDLRERLARKPQGRPPISPARCRAAWPWGAAARGILLAGAHRPVGRGAAGSPACSLMPAVDPLTGQPRRIGAGAGPPQPVARPVAPDGRSGRRALVDEPSACWPATAASSGPRAIVPNWTPYRTLRDDSRRVVADLEGAATVELAIRRAVQGQAQRRPGLFPGDVPATKAAEGLLRAGPDSPFIHRQTLAGAGPFHHRRTVGA